MLFSPDFDEDGNYILVVAAPVWKDQEVAGILLEQLDGYCISDWIGDLFLALDLGTAYIIDGSGGNIATAREEIQHQALRIAASEERFRMAMQRSRDVILEYQFETGEVTFFYMGRERKSGQVGSRVLRRYLVEEGGMQEDSYERVCDSRWNSAE